MFEAERGEINHLSDSIKLAFNSEKTFLRKFTQNWTKVYEREYLSMNEKFETLEGNINKAAEDTRLDLNMKLDSVAQDIGLAKYDVENLHLKMNFIADKVGSHTDQLVEFQEIKVNWKDILDRDEECDIANGTSNKELFGPSIHSVSCNVGFRPNQNAKFYKCENDQLFALLDDDYRRVGDSSNEAIACIYSEFKGPQNLTGVSKSNDTIYIDWDIPLGSRLSYNYIYYTANPDYPLFLWERQLIMYGSMTTLQGLVPNTSYTIRVMPRRGRSKAINVMTRKGVYMQPINLRAKAFTPNSMLISWSWPPKINVSGVINYTLFYYDSTTRTDKSLVIKPPTNTFELQDLTPGTVYRIQLSATNRHGEGAKTNILESRTLEFIPKTPKRVYVTAINTTCILVKWQSPSFPGRRSPGIIRGYAVYYVEIGDNGNDIDVIDEKTIYTDQEDKLEVVVVDLKPDTRYAIQVAGLSRKGDGMRSDSVYVTTK